MHPEGSVALGLPCEPSSQRAAIPRTMLTGRSWTVGPDWPNGGEIDIMEQVNSATKNRVTMHTSDGCTLAGTTELSSEVGTNCYAYANGNVGCGVDDNSDLSYGDGFNGAGGGVFATEWTSRSIAVWFWSRHSIPANVLSANPEPSQWGPPVARFRGDCNIDQHFREHQIVRHHPIVPSGAVLGGGGEVSPSR